MPERNSAEPEALIFTDDGSIPNNPLLPFVIFRGAVDLGESNDPARTIEEVFRGNGWGDAWRNGIYPYVHYHSMIHEGMGIARGRAKVRFGGDNGTEVDLTMGDVCVLPAGTGHQCLWASPDLLVVGAYPPAGKYNICYGSKGEHAKALQTIPNVPPPESDPVRGKQGPLLRLWHLR
jgi:uncharacterized protein YjlB